MTTFKELLEQIEKQALILKNLHEKAEKLAKDYKHIEDTIPKGKSYTWAECFKGKGYYIEADSEILFEGIANALESHKNISTTEKVCKSHLAACQLSHIIEAINKDFEDSGVPKSICYDDKNGFCMSFDRWALPALNSQEAGEKLIETNETLLKQYLGVE